MRVCNVGNDASMAGHNLQFNIYDKLLAVYKHTNQQQLILPSSCH